MNATASDEITKYVEGVRRALTGLAETTREELLEDLPEHLTEVQAEGNGTLTERLGTPEAYAKELVATAGLTAGFPEPPANRHAQFLEMRDQAREFLGRADVKIGPVIGYPKASDFLVLLRPAWWVLRGYLLAMAIAFLIEGSYQDVGLLPRLAGNDLIALVLLTGCVIVSILLGRRTLSFWPRYALISGTVVLVLFALGGFAVADDETRYSNYSDMSSYDANPYSNVNDVFVYDNQGRLVTGIRLYDQEGNPIQLGNNYCLDPDTGESRRSRSLGYPHCPENAPFGADPTPSAAPSSPAEPSASVPAAPSTAPSSPAPSSPASSAPAPTSSSTGAPAPTPTASPSK